MKRLATMIMGLIALVMVAGTASAALRSPQVTVNGGTLQGYLNGVGESINVSTDQQNIQRWQATVSNNSTFTLQVEFAGNAGTNTYGIYNASGPVNPALYQCFPGAATNGWFAVASFRTAPTRVVINTFDNNASPFGLPATFLGADRNDFGFYLQQNPSGLVLYTQDSRNAGSVAQALTFAGTGINSGSWWLCWEDTTPQQGSDQDFDDAVLFLESLNPVPVSHTSWGDLKKRFN